MGTFKRDFLEDHIGIQAESVPDGLSVEFRDFTKAPQFVISLNEKTKIVEATNTGSKGDQGIYANLKRVLVSFGAKPLPAPA